MRREKEWKIVRRGEKEWERSRRGKKGVRKMEMEWERVGMSGEEEGEVVKKEEKD